MTDETRQTPGTEGTPRPDLAACCREMAGAMADCGPALERLRSACGPMLERMRAACGGRSEAGPTGSEDADSASG